MIKAVIFDMYETLITQFESPLYYGAQIAEDIGLPVEVFLPDWRATDFDRATGKKTLEEVFEELLKKHNIYTEDLYDKIVDKRIAIQADCFCHLHEEILPMLSKIKESGVKIGLISNCFSEEAELIRTSELFPYFDAPCLSYEEGIIKPDLDIFHRCMDRLGVKAEECLYVGDGGSNELEAARSLGMQAVQAVWYRKAEGTGRLAEIRPEFEQVEKPFYILRMIKE